MYSSHFFPLRSVMFTFCEVNSANGEGKPNKKNERSISRRAGHNRGLEMVVVVESKK